MRICQLSDLHLRPPGRLSNDVVDTNRLTADAFCAIAALDPAPDVVLITGDLTECGLEAEYAVFAELVRLLPMPVYVIPGNHDRRETFRACLGHLPGITADPRLVQYAVEDHPVRIVMLDTVVPGTGAGELAADGLGFLERTLAAGGGKPTLIGMHHPPFDCGIAYMDRIKLRNDAAFVAIVARHPEVRSVVCGHHHRPVAVPVAQAIGSISPSVAHQLQLDFAPGARSMFRMEPPGYMIHCLTEAGTIVTHAVVFGDWPGPYPFVTDPDYPGKP